jgi:hypothetical protein
MCQPTEGGTGEEHNEQHRAQAELKWPKAAFENRHDEPDGKEENVPPSSANST